MEPQVPIRANAVPLLEFIASVERDHFRSDCDTGAQEHAMMIWNIVREYAGLPRITKSGLPAHCSTHDCYHVIQAGYGCVRGPKTLIPIRHGNANV